MGISDTSNVVKGTQFIEVNLEAKLFPVLSSSHFRIVGKCLSFSSTSPTPPYKSLLPKALVVPYISKRRTTLDAISSSFSPLQQYTTPNKDEYRSYYLAGIHGNFPATLFCLRR